VLNNLKQVCVRERQKCLCLTNKSQWVTLTFDLDFAKPFAELKFGLTTDLSQKVK